MDHPELRKDDCEMLWQHLEFERAGKLYLSSFYRPPNVEGGILQSLQDSIGELQSKSPRTHTNFIICGDFNLPDIKWLEGTVKTGSARKGLHGSFLTLLQDTGDVNVQTNITRPSSKNVLDLIVTSNPNIISNVRVIPGMSDHDIVLFEINMSPKIQRKPPHRIYKFDRQDTNIIKSYLNNRAEAFLSSDPSSRSVDTNWTFFKDTITEAMSKFIPSKMSKNKQTHPWITPDITRQMRKRDRLYRSAIYSKQQDTWKKYTIQRNKVTAALRKSYENYMVNIIGDSL